MDNSTNHRYLEGLKEFATKATQKSRTRVAVETSRVIELDLHSERSPAQLPLWGEEVRAFPNALIRGALFAARDAETPRAYYDNLRIATLSNIQLVYRGQELRQEDAAVFMQLLHFAREVPLGFVVEFTGRKMLRDMGWSTGSDAYERLRNSIDRMTATSLKLQVTLKSETSGYGGSLIRNFRWRSDAGEPLTRWQVWMDPEIISLFKPDAYSLIAWRQRKCLDNRSPLTLWLHAFLSSHQQPFAISVQKYAELSNANIKELKHFKQALQRALDRLQKVGFLLDWEIAKGSDIVRVTRNPEKFVLPENGFDTEAGSSAQPESSPSQLIA